MKRETKIVIGVIAFLIIYFIALQLFRSYLDAKQKEKEIGFDQSFLEI